MPNSEESLPICRCVCGDMAFEEILVQGARTMEEAERLGCGVSCGLCRGYLVRMFETGETAFAAD